MNHPNNTTPAAWDWDRALNNASRQQQLKLRDALDGVMHALVSRRINLHSFAVLHRGQVLLERYWAPYSSTSLHRMYSISKSLTALAVGICLGDGKFTLDDSIAELLGASEEGSIHPWLEATTVRDALMMRTPHDLTAYKKTETSDLVRAFFTTDPDRPPGLSFSYDTSASVVLAALVERSAGQSVSQLLSERLWPPLGCEQSVRALRTPDTMDADPRFPAWREVSENPQGVDHGGSGLLCSTRDLARVGLLLASGGRVAGHQLIDPAFIHAATSRQTPLDLSPMFSADIVSGYGYQTWITHHDGFAFLGMGGQLLLVHPLHQLVVVMTADDQAREEAHSAAIHAVWHHLLPAVAPGLNPGPTIDTAVELGQQLAAVPPPDTPRTSASPQHNPAQERYVFTTNGLNLRVAEMNMGDGSGHLRLHLHDGRVRELHFGMDHWSEFTWPQDRYRAQGYGCWEDRETLRLSFRITDDFLGTVECVLKRPSRGHVYLKCVSAAERFLDDYTGSAVGMRGNPTP